VIIFASDKIFGFVDFGKGAGGKCGSRLENSFLPSMGLFAHHYIIQEDFKNCLWNSE
jgi:hypothetical protein